MEIWVSSRRDPCIPWAALSGPLFSYRVTVFLFWLSVLRLKCVLPLPSGHQPQSKGKAPRPCRLETASQLTSSTASERHALDERPGPLKMSGRAISAESGMPCGGALEPKLQHAHFCLPTAHQRPATLEPTSRQKPERRAELPYKFTAIVSRGRVRVNSTGIRGLFECALAAMSADRYTNGHISQ